MMRSTRESSPIVRPTINCASGSPSSPWTRLRKISVPGVVGGPSSARSGTAGPWDTAMTMCDPGFTAGAAAGRRVLRRGATRFACFAPSAGASAVLASVSTLRPGTTWNAWGRGATTRAVAPSREPGMEARACTVGPRAMSLLVSRCCTKAAATIRSATPHTTGTHAGWRFLGTAAWIRWRASARGAGVGSAPSAPRTSPRPSHSSRQWLHAARCSRTCASSEKVSRPSSSSLNRRDTSRHSLVLMSHPSPR